MCAQVPLKVWLFGCPASLMSPETADIASQWTTSVVLGKDIVSRLTLPCIERLRDDMIKARCALSCCLDQRSFPRCCSLVS